jgi:hypothetical protein
MAVPTRSSSILVQVAFVQVLERSGITSCCNMSGAMSKEAIAFDRLEVQLRRRAPRAFGEAACS